MSSYDSTLHSFELDKYSRARASPVAVDEGANGSENLEWAHYTQGPLTLTLNVITSPSTSPRFHLRVIWDTSQGEIDMASQRTTADHVFEDFDLAAFGTTQDLADQLPLKAVYGGRMIGFRLKSVREDQVSLFRRVQFQVRMKTPNEVDRLVGLISCICPCKSTSQKLPSNATSPIKSSSPIKGRKPPVKPRATPRAKAKAKAPVRAAQRSPSPTPPYTQRSIIPLPVATPTSTSVHVPRNLDWSFLEEGQLGSPSPWVANPHASFFEASQQSHHDELPGFAPTAVLPAPVFEGRVSPPHIALPPLPAVDPMAMPTPRPPTPLAPTPRPGPGQPRTSLYDLTDAQLEQSIFDIVAEPDFVAFAERVGGLWRAQLDFGEGRADAYFSI